MRKNQVNTSLPSLPKWKEREANTFQLIVAGSFDKVKRFWGFLKTFSGYRLPHDYQMLFDQSDQEKDLHVVMQIEETPYTLANFEPKESTVRIQTKDGKQIAFSLLHTQIVNMQNGVFYIQGKSYDIFANPVLKREVVPCKVVDVEENQ
jgi:hypothetical protein